MFFGVLDVAVTTLGFAFQALASKLCFDDKSQLKCEFGGWECAQNVSRSVHTCGVVQNLLIKLT